MYVITDKAAQVSKKPKSSALVALMFLGKKIDFLDKNFFICEGLKGL